MHRDLKPANIMIGPDDAVTIMDFGIARATGQDGRRRAGRQCRARRSRSPCRATAGHTMAGAIIGTVEYMSPEQGKGRPADQRSDIYAFGLILYDMLVGRRRKYDRESALEELYSADGESAALSVARSIARCRGRSTRSRCGVSSQTRASDSRRRSSCCRRWTGWMTRASCCRSCSACRGGRWPRRPWSCSGSSAARSTGEMAVGAAGQSTIPSPCAAIADFQNNTERSRHSTSRSVRR